MPGGRVGVGSRVLEGNGARTWQGGLDKLLG